MRFIRGLSVSLGEATLLARLKWLPQQHQQLLNEALQHEDINHNHSQLQADLNQPDLEATYLHLLSARHPPITTERRRGTGQLKRCRSSTTMRLRAAPKHQEEAQAEIVLRDPIHKESLQVVTDIIIVVTQQR